VSWAPQCLQLNIQDVKLMMFELATEKEGKRGVGKEGRLDRHVVGGALRCRAATLVINLRRGDVPMTEQSLHLGDINAGIKQECSGGGSERMGRVDAPASCCAVDELNFFHRSWEILEVALNGAVHRHIVHCFRREFLARGIESRPKEGTACDLRFVDVLLNGLSRVVVQSDGPSFIALLMQADCCLVALDVKVRDFESATRAQPNARVEIELQDRAIAILNGQVAGRQTHQLPRTSCAQGFRLVSRIAGFTRDELRVCRVWYCDG